MSATRPALRWHGGKWMLAPWIISHLPPHRVYVEPFGGAGSVLIRKPRSYAEVWNDLDGEVVNLFRVLRSDDADRLVALLKATPFARDEFVEAYQATTDEVERARRLIIRSFMGFGSNGHNKATGFRSNSNRSGTTPAHDWSNYPDALSAIIERLRGVVIESRDATALMVQHDGADTLFYVDPPYVMSTRSDAGHDYAHEMDDEAHGALLVTLRGLAGMVVLSGYPCEQYDEALFGWRRVERAALADGAAKRTEVLWINPQASDRLDAVRMPLFGSAA
ncbi:MAG: putative DNA adenine methylase [Prokaryotic dsDNA virus sp.]|nr:MAG: putative DNA adenine methylase [Prokaryotic dsDNA virus sp.]|tara:strand:+ start:3139 stop:3972 length:834 start_codon:yes stop_codon:yes gene_type:complete